MKRVKLAALSNDDLVTMFADLAVKQDVALLSRAQRDVNRIYWKLESIEKELKSRSGDQRSLLLPLYSHKNVQVRVKAAEATLAVAPQAARAELEAIRASGWQPQAGQAGMSIRALDDGIYKPK